jgi:hypothetical protein
VSAAVSGEIDFIKMTDSLYQNECGASPVRCGHGTDAR